MLAVTKTAGLSGIRGMEVTVEVSAERGLPAYHVIGLGDTAAIPRISLQIYLCRIARARGDYEQRL